MRVLMHESLRNKSLLYNISGDSSLQYITVVPSLPKLACLPWNLSCMYHGLSLLQTESMAPCTFQLPLSIHFPSWDAECYKEAMSPGMSTGGCCNRLMWSSPLPSMNSLVWLCECLCVLSNWCIEKPNVRPTPAPASDPLTYVKEGVVFWVCLSHGVGVTVSHCCRWLYPTSHCHCQFKSNWLQNYQPYKNLPHSLFIAVPRNFAATSWPFVKHTLQQCINCGRLEHQISHLPFDYKVIQNTRPSFSDMKEGP